MAKWMGAIFDLDGVIVNTSQFHFKAWQKLAESLGFQLEDKLRHSLDGVSRLAALDIVLEEGNTFCGEEAKKRLADQKNEIYLDMISKLSEKDILPGAAELIRELKKKHIPVAIGSASKNTRFVLERIGLEQAFDVIVDGNIVKNVKPDPEVFLIASRELGIPPAECVVFEDAKVGIEAANAGGMVSFGIGDWDILKDADNIVADFRHWEIIAELFGKEM